MEFGDFAKGMVSMSVVFRVFLIIGFIVMGQMEIAILLTICSILPFFIIVYEDSKRGKMDC
jgi:hypothetical protein